MGNVINFLNSKVLIAAVGIIPLLITILKKRKHFLNLFLPAESVIIFLVQIIKRLTEMPRPFSSRPQVLGIISNLPLDYSFPSLHTALGTFFAWTLSFVYPKLSWLWFMILTVIALSRIKLGLHYPKDISAGFLLSTFVFWATYLLSKTEKARDWSLDNDIRRKLIHLFYGLILIFFLDYQIITTPLFFFWLLASFFGVISSPLFPVRIRNIITYFERDGNKKFLAVAPLLFTISAFLSWIVFPKDVAIVAILNLTIGDSVNVLAASMLEKRKGKKIEAAIVAGLTTILVSISYLPLSLSLVGAIVTGIFEFSEPKIADKKIDDNLLIPLVSGTAIIIAKTYF